MVCVLTSSVVDHLWSGGVMVCVLTLSVLECGRSLV